MSFYPYYVLLLPYYSPFKKFGPSRVAPGVFIGPFGSGTRVFDVRSSFSIILEFLVELCDSLKSFWFYLRISNTERVPS